MTRKLPASPSMRAKPRVTAVALLLLLTLLPLIAAPAEAGPSLLASTYRIDFGPMAPGESRDGSFLISNPHTEAVSVRFIQEGEADLAVALAVPTATLASGETRRITFTYTVPATATPGNRGEAIKFLTDDVAAGASGGTLAAGTAIVVTSRVTALGLLSIEAPAMRLPEEGLSGLVRLVNTASTEGNASVTLALVDPTTGSELLPVALNETLVPAGGSAAVPFEMNLTGLPRGTYALRARLAASPGAPVSGADFVTPLAVGAREGRLAVEEVRDERDGNATARIALVNTGTVPVTFRPVLNVTDPVTGLVLRAVTLDDVTLQPGERRYVNATLALPPGRFALAFSDAAAPTREVELHGIASAPIVFEVTVPPAESGRGFFPWAPSDLMGGFRGGVPFLPLLIVAGVLAGAGGAFLVARRRRRPSPAPAAAKAPRGARLAAALTAVRTRLAAVRLPRLHLPRRAPAAAPDPLDDFLTALDAPKPARPGEFARAARRAKPLAVASARHVTLLVDVRSLFGDANPPAATLADLHHLALGREGALLTASAYFAPATPAEAALARQAIAAAGITPRLTTADPLVELAMDAARAAAQGETVILATHDARLTEVARFLRERGVRFEVMGVADRIPPALVKEAATLHALPAERLP